jgi:hypothetical protein
MTSRNDEATSESRAIMAAIQEVVTPGRAKILVGMLLKNAIERQDTRAAQVLLDRVLGKVRSEPPPKVALDLPAGLVNAADVAVAANALLHAVASGQIAPEDAQRTAVIVEMVRKAIETQDLERRIAELEEHAKRENHR